MQWISQQIGEGFDTSGDSSNVHVQLKSGQRLARFVVESIIHFPKRIETIEAVTY